MSSMLVVRQFSILTVALAAALGLSYAATAWTGPSDSPPDSNASAPVNVGAASQVKAGGLGVASLVADQLCFGSDCRASWAEAGGGLDYSTTVQVGYIMGAGTNQTFNCPAGYVMTGLQGGGDTGGGGEIEYIYLRCTKAF